MEFHKKIRLPHEADANPEAFLHIVVSCIPGTRAFENRALGDAIWTVILGEQDRHAVQLKVARLMPEHLRLIVAPRGESIIRLMNDFKSYSTRLSSDFRPQRFLWQRSYHDRRIRDVAEFEAAVSYVVRNPSSAGLVEDESDWPWVGSWLDA